MSLAVDFRHWSDQDLARLLRLRPDLLTTVEDGIGALQRKAASAQSIRRRLITSDVGMVVVFEALTLIGPATADEIDSLLGVGDITAVVDAAERLAASALVWINQGIIGPVGPVDDIVPSPLGLGPRFSELAPYIEPEILDRLADKLGVSGAKNRSVEASAIAHRLRSAQGLAPILIDAPVAAVELLKQMADERWVMVEVPPEGPGSGIDPSWGGSTPTWDPGLDWLISHGLLVRVGRRNAIVPRELTVGLHSEGLVPLSYLRRPPLRSVDGLSPATIDAEAAIAANRLLELAQTVLGLVDDGQVASLKSGGVGVRELRRIAKKLGTEPDIIGQVLELVFEAGLIVPVASDLAITDRARQWQQWPRSQRWLVLVWAWIESPTYLSQALSQDSNGKTLPALSDNVVASATVDCRLNLLATMASLAPGQSWNVESLGEATVWLSPMLWGTGERAPDELVNWIAREAHLLGLVAHDSPTSILGPVVGLGAKALDPADHNCECDCDSGSEPDSGLEAEIETLAAHMVGVDQDQIMIQSDLTAMAMGPLKPAIAAQLAEIADRQLDQGTPNFSFSSSSIIRAFDRGWTAAKVITFLQGHAVTGIPQPVEYLIKDVERRYGQVQVLDAEGLIVTKDEETARLIAATPRAQQAGLTLVAPTVLAGPVAGPGLVELLRLEGILAVERPTGRAAEARLDPDGDRAQANMANGLLSRPSYRMGFDAPPSPSQLANAVHQLRSDVGAAAESELELAPFALSSQLRRNQGRPAVVTHLREADLVTLHGVVIEAGDELAVLTSSGIKYVGLDQVVSVESVV